MSGQGSPWRFRLLAVTLLLALLIPRMTQRGMFLDGITYAVVARNMAMSAGSFWKPFHTATVYPEFYEQLHLPRNRIADAEGCQTPRRRARSLGAEARG